MLRSTNVFQHKYAHGNDHHTFSLVDVIETTHQFQFLFHMEHNVNTSVQLRNGLHSVMSNNCLVWRSGK
jgi:hypothetical protein